MNHILPQLQTHIGMTGIVLLFMILHLVLGLLARGGRPFLWEIVEGAGAEIDRRLNRQNRTPSDLFIRGGVVAAVMCGFGFLIGTAVDRIALYDYGWIGIVAFLFLTVSVMGPLSVLRRASALAQAKNNKGAVDLLQPLVREDMAKLDEHTVIRRAMEYSALSLNNYFIAPLFWFLVLGPTGLAVYLMFAALYEAYGTDDSRHMMFGGLVRGFEKFLDFIPARTTALLIMLAALFVSRSNPLRGLSTALAQARLYRSTNRGWMIAALAGGLGVTLGGPMRHVKGHTIDHGWIGPVTASAKASVEDLKRAVLLHFVVFLCVIVALSVGILLTKKFT